MSGVGASFAAAGRKSGKRFVASLHAWAAFQPNIYLRITTEKL
jgi:hypothetical protein